MLTITLLTWPFNQLLIHYTVHPLNEYLSILVLWGVEGHLHSTFHFYDSEFLTLTEVL